MTSQLMTLREAAAYLGWDGRWAWRRVLRTLRALERKTKKKILVRDGGETKGRRYRVSRGALMQHFHAAWLTDGRLRDRLADEIRKYREQIALLESRVEDVEYRLGAVADAAGRAP